MAVVPVSVEAISWALNKAPVPADRGGQPSSACKFVLVGLANHAGPDGTGAFPSVATLVRYTGLSQRTVRSCLARLEAEGMISPGDPGIVGARIKRPDRRPQGWDLNLVLVRDDPAQADARVLDTQVGGARVSLAATSRPRPAGMFDGVHSLHPELGLVDNRVDEVRPLHPQSRPGCSQRRDGVQPAQPRGAAVAPEPSEESSLEPSASCARAPEPAPDDGRAVGGGPVGEFFAALADAWRLTAAQRARLSPAVEAALRIGWRPAQLAAVTGTNTYGIHSPYAVLAARLSPAELPGCSASTAMRLPHAPGASPAGRRAGRPAPATRVRGQGRRIRGALLRGIRNPAAHEDGLDLPEQVALEQLAAFSVFARWIDECRVELAP